jgi:predicted Zn-dependent protease
MQTRKIKPIYVVQQAGVPEEQMSAVLTGIREIVRLAGMTDRIPIHNFGVWQTTNHRTAQGLVPFASVQWYIEHARQTGRNRQLNATTIVSDLYEEPWQTQAPHYDLMVVKDDLWSGEGNNNFVIGCAIKGVGTVISTARFQDLPTNQRRECIVTEVLHEMGHVFGLVPEDRTTNVEYSLGKHCTNRCTMRQGLRVPSDWIEFTEDRRRHGVFCSQCQTDLRRFFAGY